MPVRTDHTSTHAPPVPDAPHGKRLVGIAAATLVGTSVEWYDFGIFSLAAATIFPTVFFPSAGAAEGVLASFAVIAVGAVARPLGAILFGHIGDRYGRRRSLLMSIVLMGIATTLIGLIPTYDAIGSAAQVLLVVFSLLQALAVGGEWGGSLLFGVESAPPTRRALLGSFTQMGSSLGLFMSSGAFALVGLLDQDAVMSWGWRIPFLASALLVLVGVVIRSKLEETPEFAASERVHDPEPSVPIVEVLRHHLGAVALAVGAFLVPIAGYYIIVNFLGGYATTELHLDPRQVSTAVMVSSVVSLVFMPLTAIVADRVGVWRVTVVGLALHVVVTFPMFWLTDLGTMAWLALAMSLGMFVSTIAYSTVGTLVSGWFPTRVRNTALSLGYQVSGMIAGGTVLVLSQWLFTRTHTWSPVAALFVVLSLVSLFCVALRRGPVSLAMAGDTGPSEDAPVEEEDA